jgi:hypothetical protein
MNFITFASSLASRPILIVTSDDGLAGENNKLFAALQKAGDKRAQIFHIATDHSYSDHRIALEQAVLQAAEAMRTQ